MNLLRKIWNDFKTQPDVWFFYGFLTTFTLSVRKVLFFYPINEQFNEYTGIYLYISDLFLLAIAISWLISILCNKQSLLSIIRTANVPRGTFLLPLLLVVWSFISISWSDNQNITLFRSIKLLEYYILFLYLIIKIVPRGTILRNTFRILISISLIQVIVGTWQILVQHSIGLFWLKESLISPEIAGVAKLIFNQEKIIRAYGLFPHPNILGGFLLFSIILTLVYRKMFHARLASTSGRLHESRRVEQNKTSKLDIKCSTPASHRQAVSASRGGWNNSHCETYKPTENVPRPPRVDEWSSPRVEAGGTISSIIPKAIHDRAYSIILAIQIVAIILTFSKSAILGLIIAIGYAYWTSVKTYATKLFHVEHIGRKLIILLGIFVALIVIIQPDINSLFFKSLDERILYLNVSRGTISQNPIFGIGSGQFVANMRNNTNQALSDWQFQPVHNVFLLIWSELGLVGLILFIWMLWKLFHVEQFEKKRVAPESSIKCSTWNNSHCETYEPIKNVPRGTFPSIVIRLFQGLFLGLTFIMLFDHYLWDIQQGQMILWMALAFLISI
ncbi:MAG: O-antigen ligase family protein [Candidatus Moranbacteria bacterium]|nr:O-antigen ligase family protein [Candidatus Moranbacteria bacterium]